MLNGNYLLADTSRSADTVNNIASALNENVVTAGTFSLNPANNPTFSVSGRDPLSKPNGVFAFTSNDNVSNGGNVVIEVAVGLDAIPLKADSLKVFVQHYNGDGTVDGDKIFPETEAPTKSGTSYKFVVPLSTSSGLVIGQNYLFGVEGTDQNGNPVVASGAGWGFHLASSGAAPTLNVTSPSANISYLKKGDGLVISGTILCEEGYPTLDIYQGETRVYSKTYSIADPVDASVGGKQYAFSYTVPAGAGGFDQSNSNQYAFTIKGSLGDSSTPVNKTVIYDIDAPTIDITSMLPTASKYLTDESGNTDGKEYLNGDVTLKLAIIDDYDAVDVSKNKPYFEIVDGSGNPLSFKVDAEPESTRHEITTPTKQNFVIHTKDIASADDGSDAKTVKLRIYAWDRSGNRYVEKDALGNVLRDYYEKEYTVDQSTDNPVILPNSASSVTLKYDDFSVDENDSNKTKAQAKLDAEGKSSMAAGSQMYIKLIDDDGLSTISVYSIKNDDVDVFNTTPTTEKVSGQEVVYPVKLSNNAGYYQIGLIVTDINSKETKIGPFLVRVTAPAPTITGITVSPTHVTTNDKNVNSPKNTFTNTIEISSTEYPFYVFRKEGLDFTDTELGNIKTSKTEHTYYINSTTGSSTSYVDTITPSTDDTTKTHYYVVYDKNWNDSNVKSVECKIDTTRPEVILNSVPSNNDTKAEVPSFSFQGTSKDETGGSQIRAVRLTVSDGTNSKTIDVNGTENWLYSLRYTDSEWQSIFGTSSTPKQGTKYIKVEAIDNAGNVSNKYKFKTGTEPYPETETFDGANPTADSTWKSFIYDVADPTTDVKGIQELLSKEGFTISGTATDSYKLKKVEIFRKTPGEASAESVILWDNIDATTKDWSVTIKPKDKAGASGEVVDGEYVFTIYVTDVAGNEVLAKTIKTTVDTTPPTISFDSTITGKTGVNALTETNSRFSGSFVEDNLAGIYYQILPANTSAATVTEKTTPPAVEDRLNSEKWVGTNAAPLNWKSATPGTTTWNFFQEFYSGDTSPAPTNGELREGSYKLYMYAIDKAANLSSKYELSFDVDMNKPEVSENFTAGTNSNFNNDGSTIYFYGTLDITATATDTNALDGSKPLTVKLGGTEISPSSGKYTITESYFASENTSKQLVFTAKDIAGKTNEKKYSVIWDKTAPSVDITTPDADLSGESSITTAETTFRGTVKDSGVGIEDNKYKYLFTKTALDSETLADVKTASASWVDATGQSFSSTKNDLTEGKWILYIYAEDKLGLGNFAKRTFCVDNAKPVVSVTTQPLSKNYVNLATKNNDSGVKFEGTITESNELVSFEIFRSDTAAAIKSFEIGSGEGKIVATPNGASWSFVDTTAGDNEYTYSFVATDAAGRTNVTTEKVVVVDTVLPGGTSTVSKPEAPAYATFYNKSQVTLKVTPADQTPSSGIDKVYYSTVAGLPANDSSWIEMDNRTDYFDATVAGLSDGKQTYYFLVKDKAGNTNTSEIKTEFNVDTSAPDTITVSAATVNSVLQTISQAILVNGRNDVVLTFTASDVNSDDLEKSTGVASVTLSKIGSKTPTTVNAATESSGTWTLTITKDNLSTGNIVLKATDKAGNSADITTSVSIDVDNTAPTVSGVQPASFIGSAAGDAVPYTYTVNKKIQLKGKATDNNLASVDVVYWDTAASAWKNVYHTTSNNSDWTTSDIDTSDLMTDGETYTFVVIAIDKAGNCNLDTGSGATAEAHHKTNDDGEIIPDYTDLAAFNAVSSNAAATMNIAVDQDTDRPEITLTNMTLYNGTDPTADGALMTQTNTIKMSSSSIIGQVSDDDGLGSLVFKYCVSDEEKVSFEDSDWKNPDSLSSGTWTITIPEDGIKKLYFKVTDAGGATYTSEFGNAYNVKTPIIKDGAVYFGTKSSPDSTLTALNITIDTKNPYVEAPEYKRPADASKGFEGDKNWSSALSSQSFGGYKNKFNIRQYAYDSNGIESVTAELETRAEDSVADGFSYTRDLSITYKAGGSIPVTQEISGYTYTEWATTTEFSTAGLASGPRELKISVFDGTRTTETTKTINIDNEAPGLTVESHEKNAQVGTDFVLKGNLTDGDIGSSIRYVINTTATDIAVGDTIWNSDDTSTELSGVTALTWRLCFTQGSGVMVNGEGYTADLKPKHYVAKLMSADCEVNDSGTCVWKADSPNLDSAGAKAGDPYTDIVQAYIHFRQEDSLGNAGIWKFPIKIDPQGEIPSITMSYPSETDDGKLTANLSGIIRTQGSAFDDKNIAGLYMQIDPDYNGTFATNWDDKACASYKAGTPASGYANLTEAGYNIENLYDKYKVAAKAAVDADSTISDSDKQAAKNAIDAKSTDKKGIYIGKGTSWSFAINTKGEFNSSTNENKKIAIRLYAVDTDGNISMPKAEEDFVITIDASLPQIGSSEQLYLYKGKKKTGASMEYKEGMWLSGKWYLTGSVEDASGIKEATIGNTNLIQPGNKKTFTSGTEGYYFEVEIGSDTPGTYGKLEYRISVKDETGQSNFKDITVNFDNKKPILEGSKDDYYNLVKNGKMANSSGFYTLGSAAYEASGESGFKRTAFYFKRTIHGSQAVYDSYLAKKDGTTEGYNKYTYKDKDTNTANPGVTIDDGDNGDFLPWMPEVTVSSVSGRELTLAAAPGKSVHKGGLAKVSGTIYTITDINGSVITLDGSPEKFAKEIQFAIAHVVDHSGAESVGKTKCDTTSDYGYGYYTDSLDDDGDMMIETVSTSGTQTIWSATINSRNIPDGAVELHYVVFDKAGNCTHEVKEVTVQNNAPRLASVTISTDYDGDGAYSGDDETYTAYYSRKSLIFTSGNRYGSREAGSELIASGNNKGPSDGGTSVMTVFSTVKFEPEIIGGNGELFYTYKIDGQENKTQEKSGAANKLALMKADKTTQIKGYDDREEDYMKEDDEYNSYVEGHKDGVIIYEASASPASATSHTMDNLSNGLTWFNYTIWDSTEGLTAGSDSLNATMSICLNVKYHDDTKPFAGIRPFFWNSKTDNSIAWESDEAAGHIELEDDLSSALKEAFGDTDPKVSGKIKFEGYAYDDVRIKELYVEMSDHAGLTTSRKVAEYDTSWIYTNGTGYEVSCTNLYCNSNGHLVKWTVTVDTCAVASGKQVVGKDRIFKVLAKDKNNNSSTVGSTQTALAAANKKTWGAVKSETNASKDYCTDVYGTVTVAQAKTNAATLGTAEVTDDTVVYTGFNPAGEETMGMTSYYKVDVVPYITKIESGLGNNNRSSNGRYQISANETKEGSVKVHGFNLAANNGTVDISSGMGSQASGAYSLEVGAAGSEIETINNKNDDTKPYNSQANSSVSSMTDDIALDMWQFNSKAVNTTTANTKISQPMMHYNSATGNLGFAFSDGSNKYSMPNGTSSSYRYWEKNYAKYVESNFVFDASGRAHAISVGIDTYPEEGSYKAGRMNLFDSNWGVSGMGVDGNFSGTNSIHLDAIGIGTEDIREDRFSSIAMALAEHNDHVMYIAYYDQMYNRIVFRYGLIKDSKEKTNTTDYGNQLYHKGDGISGFKVDDSLYSIIADGDTTNGRTTAGEYVDLAVIPGTNYTGDVVCAVWFTGTDLKYSHKVGPCSDNDLSKTHGNGYWSEPETLLTNGGKYCKVKVDANGGVHVAAYDGSVNGVTYFYKPSYTGTTTKVVLDASSGQCDEIFLDVALNSSNKAVPAISYYSNGKIKMAQYSTGITGVPAQSWENSAFTGNWDVCYVPTSATFTKADRVNVAIPKNTRGIMEAVKVSGTTAEFTAQGRRGSGTVGGNGTTNAILGYAIYNQAETQGYIEIAQRK